MPHIAETLKRVALPRGGSGDPPRSVPAWAATALLLLLALAAAAPAADQPQWGRFHTRNMVSDEKGLPDTFDPATGRGIKWVADVGTETHDTPVVAGGKVLIGTNNYRPRDPRHDGDRGVLMCFNESDGAFAWQLVVPKLTYDIYWDWTGCGMCSPPSVEGDRIYTVTNRGEVVCLTLAGQAGGNQGPYLDEGKHMAPPGKPPMEVTKLDADIVWLYDMVGDLGIRQHDAACGSILIDGPLLYVNTSNGVDNTHRVIRSPDAPSLVVIEKATGRLVGRDDLKLGDRIVHCTWSSPTMAEVGGRKLVVFGGGDGTVYAFEALAAVPPAGKVEILKKVWWFDCDPAAPKENTHTYMGNRKESPSNIKGTAVFYKNRVYVTAGGDIWWGKNECWLKCIDATKTGDVTKTAEIWSAPLNKHGCATPSIANGLVFVTDLGKTIHCIDAETGQTYWTHEAKGEFWASTLVADGKVYAGSRRGDFTILAADKEKKVLCTVLLDSAISATPVAANGVLYITTQNKLYAVRKKAEEAK
jgi:outer membrane protein assembly factor BamB